MPATKKSNPPAAAGSASAGRATAVARDRWYFALAAFLGAFLLFQIQPLVARRLLPWYGGSPAVWATSLLFFQTGLLVGYAYAHGVAGRLAGRAQVIVHLALLAVALLMPVLPGIAWAPSEGDAPTARILLTLAATVGLPYVALAATSPLLQAWWTARHPRVPPWGLFAWSNAGSLLALVTYPFVVEPAWGLEAQAVAWRWSFVALGIVLLLISRKALGAATSGGAPGLAGTRDGTSAGAVAADAARSREAAGSEDAGPVPATQRPWRWIAWSAAGVALFMSVTNQLTLNVAVVPFLWVLPLAIYLLTFILAFRGGSTYPRALVALLVLPALFALHLLLPGDIQNDLSWFDGGPRARIAIASAALFVLCWGVHGELYRARPSARRLTSYYLAISFGGVLGGAFVGLLAPQLFLLQQELQVAALLTVLFYALTFAPDPLAFGRRAGGKAANAAAAASKAARAPTYVAALTLVALLGATFYFTKLQLDDAIAVERSFFGLHRVKDVPTREGNATPFRGLYHGSTLHGLELQTAAYRGQPTLYYGPITGAGLTMRILQRTSGRHVGIVGMGAGTLAAYARPADRFRFYEIDPDVVTLARDHFTFLASSPGRVDVVLGDARLSLEREEPQAFDILVLDAFSSDAVPVHLLTVEAFEGYLRHLKPDGVIAVHLSNRMLNLVPVLDQLAAAVGLPAMHLVNENERGGLSRQSRWALVSRTPDVLREVARRARESQNADQIQVFESDPSRSAHLRVWTDSYSSLVPILR